ncbi:capsular exopolysaccharide family protein EpsD [Chitinispirillum alkaliphilum]|nr:capsular exopolysaccharide family protein EpsD [Chitinispirillum alkaliphilum]
MLASGRLSTLEEQMLPGIKLIYSEEFLRNPHSFSFAISSMSDAIEWLYYGLKISPPDARRQIFHIEVSLKGKDYPLIAEILNTVADAYVERRQQFQIRKTERMLQTLQVQHDKAWQNLSEADIQLKNFRTNNPTVGLTRSTQQTVDNLIAMETSVSSTRDIVENARELLAKISQASGLNRIQSGEEILVFLNQQRSTSGAVLQMELHRLRAELRTLKVNYSSSHPIIQEKQANIEHTLLKVIRELQSFISKSESEINQKTANMRNLSSKLQNLPGTEMELAELERQHRISSEIYTVVLDRYNQAKISQTIEMADVYILDYAVPPIPPPPDYMKMLAICLAVGLLGAFGPPVVFDMTNKTVRTEFELRKMAPYTVLETIPKVGPAKSSRRNKEGGEEVKKQKGKSANGSYQTERADMLLTSDYRNDCTKELLRSLRSKVLMMLEPESDKSMVVSSLDAEAGKSIIAANLAMFIALQGKKTLLIDGDLRKGVCHQLFGVEKSPGFYHILKPHNPDNLNCEDENTLEISNLTEEQVTKKTVMSAIRSTHINNLHIIPCGDHSKNSSELLSSMRFKKTKEILSSMYEVIIFDSPPLGAVCDAAVINECFPKYLFVVKAGETNIVHLKNKIGEYPALEEKIAGVVLNCGYIGSLRKYYKYLE